MRQERRPTLANNPGIYRVRREQHGCRQTKKDLMAEGVGFEPTEARRPQRLSRPSHSSALASFRRARLAAGPGGPAVGHLRRRMAKNSTSRAAQRSASTPPTTGMRWLSRGSATTFISEPAAPAFGSVAP
jgi:hypothetical protein